MKNGTSKSTLRNKINMNIQELIKYYDIGYILNNLDSLILLPLPIKRPHTTEKQQNRNIDISVKNKKLVQEAAHDLQEELNLRKSVFKEVRQSYPKFCTSIKSRLTDDEYTLYLSLLRQSSKKISNFMTDTKVSTSNYKELLLIKKDIVSSIIDSEQTAKLSQLEDDFLLKELNDIDTSIMNDDIIIKIDILKKQLKERLDKTNLFYKLYSKGNEIRLVKGREIGE